MATRRVTVELDEATIDSLAALGEPVAVLGRLARAMADGMRREAPQRREQTDESLRLERGKADAIVPETESFATERKTTDRDLSGERTHLDSLVADQREANERMVAATIRAEELAEEAAAARERAEQSERELRSVAEVRETFIGVLGHDLRNPLGSIVMSAGTLLQHQNLDDHDTAAVGRILRGAQRMSRMITQLLDLTRARLGGGIPIERKPTDLGDLCRGVAEEFEPSVELQLEGDLTGTWDADRLAEVLSNLVGNAIEYATRGTAVEVRAHGEKAEVVVEVIDQGPPIPPDVLPFIFEPFRRAQGHKKSAAGNLGLGLFIAHELVLAHGGTLEVRSAEGATTFTVRLPRSAPAVAAS